MGLPATRSRSFNASMDDWRKNFRGEGPDTVWGAKALAALRPWEDRDLCLSHAVALALEAAYNEGKSGTKPSYPKLEIRPTDLHVTASTDDCEDCPPKPIKRVVRSAASPVPATRKPRAASSVDRYATLTAKTSTPSRIIRKPNKG